MLKDYFAHAAERAALGIPPLPLTPDQTSDLVTALETPAAASHPEWKELLETRVSPGVSPSAEIKAAFLADLGFKRKTSPLIDAPRAAFLLGTMRGGYNIEPLIGLLDADAPTADAAEAALKQTLLVYESFKAVQSLSKTNHRAKRIIESWADKEWLTARPALPDAIRCVAFRVQGEVNTDDFSPASEAFTRPDIPLHALSMGRDRFPGGLAVIQSLREKTGLPVAFVADVVGTGSSRKSAANSLIWHIGNDIPFVPNKRSSGIVLGGTIAPIFFNTCEDSGALPIECYVASIQTGDELIIRPFDGKVLRATGDLVSEFKLTPESLADEFRAGGRINLLIGNRLTDRAREALGRPAAAKAETSNAKTGGYTLAQKMVGRACGLPGVHPGDDCLPLMTTVGSQDTTGPMTADELVELANLNFCAGLVMQSFCHTAAMPNLKDLETHRTLPQFITARGGVSLRPGDGVIHSWLNRLLLPDTVGTGGDSHTRFPIGISFPAGSGLVALAAALGVMPLQMPESVRVRLTGQLKKGITLRDVVNAIPLAAINAGLLTVAAENKVNVFNGRILEIEGLPSLPVEEAFELTNASAERSAAGATIDLAVEPVIAFMKSNLALIKTMVATGYESAETLNRRAAAIEAWLRAPSLLRADSNADYAADITVSLDDINEPILACPNNPDDVRPLSAVAGEAINEVFIGSCMTRYEHFVSAAAILSKVPDGKTLPTRLWIAPPTRMIRDRLIADGHYSVFDRVGAKLETPGCSLCMGNQKRTADGATVLSASTRNFPNRMGKGTRVYLGGAELCALTAMTGCLPSASEYFAAIG